MRLTDLESGEEFLNDSDPGRYFFGVDGEVFTETAYIRQVDGSRIDGRTVSEAIENMLFSGNERIDSEKARTSLERARTALLYKNRKGGAIYELGIEKDRIYRKLEESREQNRRLTQIEKQTRDLLITKEELDKERSRNDALIRAREGGRTLEKFALLDKCSDEVDRCRIDLDEYRESVKANDFVPDEQYLDSIVTIESETRDNRGKLAAAKSKLQALGGDKINADDLELLGKAEKDGGEQGIREFFENCRRSAKFSKTLAIFFTVFTVLWTALAAVCLFVKPVSEIDLFGFSMKYVGFITAGVAAIMLILAIVFLIRQRSIHKKADRKNEYYGVTSENDIYVEITVSTSRLNSQNVYLEDVAKANAECDGIAGEIAENESDMAKAAARWGRTLVAVYTSENLIAEVRAVLEKLNAKESALNAALGKYETAASLTSGLDREAAKRDVTLADVSALTDGDEKDAKEKLDELDSSVRDIEKQINGLELEKASLLATVKDSAALLDEYNELCGRSAALIRKHAALELACKTLEKASESLRADVSPRLSMQASELMRKATYDKYGGLTVTSDLGVKYGTSVGGVSYSSHEADYMSEGTKDVAYLSLRLALVGFMYKKELPPLIFDESFSRLDDKRLEGMFRIISEYVSKSGQAFIFTSQGREARIMENVSPVNHIML